MRSNVLIACVPNESPLDGRGRRKALPGLLADTPGLAVVIDTFEQRTHRPKRRQRGYYSGKKKAHTVKTQVGVDKHTGRVVDVSDSVPGPWADSTVLKKSERLNRLPKGVGGIGALAYVGIEDLHPGGLGAATRRKPRGEGAATRGPAVQPGVQSAADCGRACDRAAEEVPGGRPCQPA